MSGRIRWVVIFTVLLLLSCTAPGFADAPSEALPPAEQELEGEPPHLFPATEEFAETTKVEAEGPQAIEPELTDPSAAEGVAHRGLERDAALELLEGVFGLELEGPAGPFDELHVEKFLSDNVAVIAPGDQPEASFSTEGGPTLIESTIPLRTETDSGAEGALDLGLRQNEGELQPINPLVEAGLPEELGEGIELPGPGVKIELANAPSTRAPTTAAKSVAFYPNVAEDTDFAAAPTLAGVETLTQIRSSNAPTSQTLDLTLPEGAQLNVAKDGGAEITNGDQTLVDIPPPTAIDATGAKVPVELAVSGDSLTLAIAPTESTAYPVLLDPLFQTYEWYAKTIQTGITGNTGAEQWSPEIFSQKSPYTLSNHVGSAFVGGPGGANQYEMPGLYAAGGPADTAGHHASWIYTVPRYFSDYQKYGERPRSYISHMTLSDLYWQAWSGYNSPYLVAGLWDSKNGWVSLLQQVGREEHGLTNMSYPYEFGNNVGTPSNPQADKEVKLASVGVWALEDYPGGGAALYVGAATLELGEATDVVPAFSPPSVPSGWVNTVASPISFSAEDAGLGIYAITVSDEQTPSHSWKTSYGCVGVSGNACPRAWSSTESGHPSLKYEPSVLPQGTDTLKLVAEDPLGHVSTPAKLQVKVDHTAPEVTLSGTLTEQEKLGPRRSSYLLKVNASDGAKVAPQSGVAKTVIELDGKVVDQAAPGCVTENCAMAREWLLDSSQYATGTHTVKVTATDAVGLSTSKTLTIQLQQQPPPSVSLSGTMTEQASLGSSRPRYNLKVNAAAEAGAETLPGLPPSYSSAFGAKGAGEGQMSSPADVAVDSQGNVWVADRLNNRLEKFNAEGKYLTKVGSSGTGNGQFNHPSGIAIDAKGNLWVVDSNNNRLQEFNEKGEFLKVVGSAGSGNGQFNFPEGIAIDAKGNIWVSDTNNHRVEKFSETGAFVKATSVNASELGEPTGIAAGPAGKVWVADWRNNRIAMISEAGEILSQFGIHGGANGQFRSPAGVEVDSKGNVWVIDTFNSRVQEFNQSGEYVSQFGWEGAGAGQFGFAAGAGIATDGKGTIWVADPNNNRIQKWVLPRYMPAYSTTLGASGSGNGQMSAPGDVAIDVQGNLWVADKGNNRIEKFSAQGSYLSKFGASGAGNGQFNRPTSLAIDAKGNLWVVDSNNNRLQEFNEKGEFLKAVGSSGIGNGQFSHPEGIAIDAKGNLWISDTNNGRVQKFNEKGEFVKVVSSKGSGSGQLGEPTGIAVGTGGKVWVADWQNNRISIFSEAGEFVQQYGAHGGANGQFRSPDAIDVDAKGNVWVSDTFNGRVQEFNQSDEYLSQFGSEGSGQGQFAFSAPTGIATDSKGGIWVTDPGNNRLQEWTDANSTSELSTEITIDGKQVNHLEATCAGEKCRLTPQWTLEAPAYSVGKHTIQVKATDGLGRTTTKPLTIEIQRDTAKPILQSSGPLVEAPGGWVEQESYGLNVSATDTGSGMTFLAFKIDGSTVASKAQECPDGGCTAMISQSINMASYSGGSHAAELVATDGAGNTATKHWEINVDPEGHITTTEVEDTLEAADGTAESTVLVPTSETISAEERADGNDPSLIEGEAGLESRGVPDLSVVDEDPNGGFTIQTPVVSVHAEPTLVNNNSTNVIVSEETAAVAGNTNLNVDTVIRPTFNGLLAFQSIRDASAPETYSWEVKLPEEEKLKLLDPKDAEVDFADGTEALLISAEFAHDALGKEVPTSLSVSDGNILTLTVLHREATYTYPVVAGSGWEGGFKTETVQRPKDEQEIREERERIEREEREAIERQSQEEMEGGGDESPGEGVEVWDTSSYRPKAWNDYAGPPEMIDWKTRKHRTKATAGSCASLSCDYWHTWEIGTWFWNGKKNQVGGTAWQGDTAHKCFSTDGLLFDDSLLKLGWSGPNPAPYGYGAHLNMWCNFHVEWLNINDLENNYYTEEDHLYGDGYQGRHYRQYYPGPEE